MPRFRPKTQSFGSATLVDGCLGWHRIENEGTPECTREEPEQHAKFVPEQLKTGVQTVDASALWRYAPFMVV